MPRPRLSRIVHGDPPVATPVERFTRYGFAVAYVLGVVGLVGAGRDELVLGLLAPAGALLLAIGVLAYTNHAGARDAMNARSARGRMASLGVPTTMTPFTSALLIAIGAGWTLMGVGALVSEL